MIIAVDFDGTMVPDCFPHKPTGFLPGAKETLMDLHNLGFDVIVWSLRCSYHNYPHPGKGNPCYLMNQFLAENGLFWLAYPSEIRLSHGVRVLADTLKHGLKFPADLFIEDKVPGGFCGWDKVRKHFGLAPLPGLAPHEIPAQSAQETPETEG